MAASYIQIRPTVIHFFQHKLFAAATYYQRMNLTKIWMPLHELTEPKETGRPLIKTVKWSLLMPAMRQFPFSQINYCKLGHQIKDRQLQRPRNDKMVHDGCYASSGRRGMFFSFPAIHWSQKTWKQLCSNQVANMAYLTCHTKTLSTGKRNCRKVVKKKESLSHWFDSKEPFISCSNF